MYTHTYTSVSKLPDDNLLPIIKYTPYTHASLHTQSYQSQLSPTALSHLVVMPLINLPSYLGLEAIDTYITTQVNDIHTIARRMDDEVKTPCQYLNSHLIVLNLGIWKVIIGTLQISNTYLYSYQLQEKVLENKNFCFNYTCDN